MNDIAAICSRIYALQPLPMSLVDGEGRILQSWPETIMASVRTEMNSLAIQIFRRQDRDPLHPLILFFDSGFFVGMIEIQPELYLMLGLCSPYHPSRRELMELCMETVFPERMQQYCDAILKAPVVTLPQLRACIALFVQIMAGESIPEENILLCENTGRSSSHKKHFSDMRFRQREDSDEHVTLDYENGVCQAIALGRSDLLKQALYAAPDGSVGSMSSDSMRQVRYSFICFATLISRAAIQGGMIREDAFLLSDLYCQRMDALTERSEIELLSVRMAMDFCDKVAEDHQRQHLSPVVRKALNYISVHLHEAFTMEDLSACCGLCRRSLSIRFRQETGLSVVEHVQNEKIGEARFLLEHTKLTLPEISSCLNYSSQSYFTAQFRKIVGETPEQYRKKRAIH